MLNRTIIHQGPSTVHVTKDVTVKEQRAPTDESVRLLQEMQEKALQSVLFTGVEELSADLAQYAVSHTGYTWTFHLSINLSGKRHELKIPLSYFDILRAGRERQQQAMYIKSKVEEKLQEFLIQHLSAELFKQAYMEIVRGLQGIQRR